ncbi:MULTISPECIES: hypothetical protein [Aeromonas]|uniref:hypothetical protein n=1 Tax=Aeromonas TaxID=642 RepID=UPI000CDBE518|nr:MULTISPECIES: hypothetical protein [Aeromonas]AUY11557.1 hypothetical protein C3F36_20175 [Aeromonas sp. ASNIH2]MBL0516110.1 hypothetical protein [Aeromonas caviae]
MINKDDFQQMALKNRFLLEQFTDFKEFFLSWTALLNKNGDSYLIENDGREGWLILYSENSNGGWDEVQKVVSHKFHKDDYVKQCELWLSRI